MTELLFFSVENKKGSGKGAARDVRKQNRIPAIVYGGKENIMVSLPSKEFLHEYYKGNFQSKIAELTLDGKKITVMPKDVQLHPVTDIPEHVDFQEIDVNSEIKIAVHVKVLNGDKCPGVKKGGVLNIAYRHIEVWCLPKNIPENIEIDAVGLEIGQNLHINDITLPKGATPVDKTNFTVVSVSGREKEDGKASGDGSAAAGGDKAEGK